MSAVLARLGLPGNDIPSVITGLVPVMPCVGNDVRRLASSRTAEADPGSSDKNGAGFPSPGWERGRGEGMPYPERAQPSPGAALRPLPPGRGDQRFILLAIPARLTPSGMTPCEICSAFVLDNIPNLGYRCWCPGSMRGALARRRMCRSRERSWFGLASRAGRPIVARHGVRLKEPCARGRQVLLPLTSEPDDLSRLPHPTTSGDPRREAIPHAHSILTLTSRRP